MLKDFKLDLGFADDPSWALADILEFVCGNAGGDVVVLSIRGHNIFNEGIASITNTYM